MNKYVRLKNILGNSVLMDEPLKNHTFLKIGGSADVYLEVFDNDEFKKAIIEASKRNIPITVLGAGSNVLISDNGIRGLVLVNHASKIKILDKDIIELNIEATKPEYRWESDSETGTFKYEFKDLDYNESDKPRIKVRMDSGVSLPLAIDYLLDKGVTGLQWYAGIPGTIGGAVFNNIHGGTHFISEVIESVNVIETTGKEAILSIKELGVGYDKSRFQNSGEFIIDVTFLLFKGDEKKAKYVRYEWAKRKSIQPKNSPGCAFHNLTQEQKEKLGIPTTSAGYIIEHLLKMTGFRIGDAAISDKHNNFIVNLGKATALDYLLVMKEIYKKAKKELGITMVPEIFFLGFKSDEIKEFLGREQYLITETRNREIKTVYKDSKDLFTKTIESRKN